MRQLPNITNQNDLCTDSMSTRPNIGRGHCKVQLDANGHELLAFLAGRLMKNSIRIVAGDRVVVEVSAYDPGHGRIVWRHP
jgi:translation initiation factor IF-1